MPKFKVTSAGFVAGAFHPAGAVLDLSDRQAATGIRRGRGHVVTKEPITSPSPPTGEGNQGEGATGGEGSPEVPALSLEETRAKLDALGVKYRANATHATLTKLLAETVAASDPTA